MQDEMRFHIEMEAERLVREEGLDPQEARRQAHVRFGGLEKFKEQGRDTRGLQWLDAVSLDARLAVRMLVKHRGLTLVGGFAMSVAIAIGAMFFEVMTEMLNPALPLEDGERIVALQYATAIPGNPERRVLHDFLDWRDELVSVEQLAAFRTVQHNLVSGNAPAEPIDVAEMTAVGIRRCPHTAARSAGTFCRPMSARRGPRRGDRPSGLAVAFRRRPANRGAHDQSRWDSPHRRRRHAGRFQVSAGSSVLDPAPRKSAGVRTIARACAQVLGRLAPGVTWEAGTG